jgi:hypothetical protein
MRLKNILTESGAFNKKVKSDLDSYLKGFKEGTPTHQWAVKEILKAALTDANFHSEAKKVDSMFSRARYEDDSAKEKSYQNAVERKGIEIANKAKWNGHEIIDAISFYTSMTIGHPLGQKVNSLKENSFTQNKNKVESKLTLKGAMGEAKSDYEVYHKSYTSAIEAARAYAEKKGYEINNDDAFTKIGMGPRKPSEGKTNRFDIELSKDGKVQKKKLQIQVYGMKNSYELNAYIQ